MIATITFFKWGFFRQQRLQALERIRCYQNVVSTVAHEMRIPLASILLTAKGLKRRISENKFYEIEKIQQHIETLASQAQITIDMLLFRLGKSVPKTDFVECSLSSCLEEAILQYPFEKGEREKLDIAQRCDIHFLGDRRLIIHVIFNLIKNSLFAIQRAKKGSIFILIDGQRHQLRFKDTAHGISSKNAKKLFREFFTTKSCGTGMGLFFCKQAMTQLGGNITFSTEDGQFTEFVLSFPQPQYQLGLANEISITL